MKRILLFLLSLCSLGAMAQEQIQTKRAVITEKMWLKDRWITSISTNLNSNDSTSEDKLVTAKAVADWVRAHPGGGGGGADGNNYPTSISFNTGTGILTMTRSGLSSITADFDGKYFDAASMLNDSTIRLSINGTNSDLIVKPNLVGMKSYTDAALALKANQQALADTAGVIRAAKAAKIRLSEWGIISDADVSFGSSTFGSDQTAAIQAILNTSSASTPLYVIWDVKVSVTGLKIKSFTTIVATEGSGAILRDHSDNYLLRTHGWTKPFTTIENYNITIDGGIWNGNGWRGGDSMQARNHATLGPISGFHLVNVRNIVLKNLTVTNTPTFGILGANWDHGYVNNINIDQGVSPYVNQDGIDLLGHMTNITITNSRFRCGDERIIFVANPPKSNYGYETPYKDADGDQIGIRIDNIEFYGAGKGFRFNSSANRLENVNVSNVYGIAETYYLLVENGDNLALFFPVEAGPGHFKNMVFENLNVEVNTNYASDYLPDFVGCIMLGGGIEGITFKNLVRNNLNIDRPTITINNNYSTTPYVIKDLLVDGYTSLESDTTDAALSHFLVMPGAGTVESVRLSNVKIKHSGLNGSILFTNQDTVYNLQMHNVAAHDVANFVYNSGLILTISGTMERHTGVIGSGATFKTTSTAVSNILLSNYYSQTSSILDGTFTNQKGDAFVFAGGGESLAATLGVGNGTGNGIGLVFETTAQSNANLKLYNTPITDNIGVTAFYPNSGSNVGAFLDIVPKGTGFNSTIKAGFNVYNKDKVSDGTNTELLSIRSAGAAYTINAIKAGTGSLRPIAFQMDGVSAIAVNTDRSMVLYNVPTGDSDDSVMVISNGVLKNVAQSSLGGGGSSQWDDISGGIEHTTSTNSSLNAVVRNSSNGASAIASLQTKNDANEIMLVGKLGSGYSGSGLLTPSTGYIYSSNNISVLASSAPISFSTDAGTTTALRIAPSTNEIRAASLSGTGTRMVVADASGNLATQTIPSGGGSDLTGAAVKANVHFLNDADYTVASTDYIIIGNTLTTNRTITLPAASSNANRVLIIKHGGQASNILTNVFVKQNSATSTQTLGPNSSWTLISDGTDWWIAEFMQ